jgi:predicted AAA+ superfamily ATPase
MLAHEQAALLNASHLATSPMIGAQTVTRYIDLLVDLLLVRRLRPFHINVGKRLVRSPKVYVRDSGIVHALLGIGDYNALSGHPVVGASWEGFAIENLIAARLSALRPASIAPRRARKSISFWRFPDTADGLSTSNEAGLRSPRRGFIWPSRT